MRDLSFVFFQLVKTVSSPTNIILFKQISSLLLDIDLRNYLRSSELKSMDEKRCYESYCIRCRAPRGMRHLSFVFFSVGKNGHRPSSYKYYPIQTNFRSIERC